MYVSRAPRRQVLFCRSVANTAESSAGLWTVVHRFHRLCDQKRSRLFRAVGEIVGQRRTSNGSGLALDPFRDDDARLSAANAS